MSNIGRFTMGFANWSPLALEVVAFLLQDGRLNLSISCLQFTQRSVQRWTSLHTSELCTQTNLHARARNKLGGLCAPLSLLGTHLCSPRCEWCLGHGCSIIKLLKTYLLFHAWRWFQVIPSLEPERTNGIWYFIKCLQWLCVADVWGLANGNTSRL